MFTVHMAALMLMKHVSEDLLSQFVTVNSSWQSLLFGKYNFGWFNQVETIVEIVETIVHV